MYKTHLVLTCLIILRHYDINTGEVFIGIQNMFQMLQKDG